MPLLRPPSEVMGALLTREGGGGGKKQIAAPKGPGSAPVNPRPPETAPLLRPPLTALGAPLTAGGGGGGKKPLATPKNRAGEPSPVGFHDSPAGVRAVGAAALSLLSGIRNSPANKDT